MKTVSRKEFLRPGSPGLSASVAMPVDVAWTVISGNGYSEDDLNGVWSDLFAALQKCRERLSAFQNIPGSAIENESGNIIGKRGQFLFVSDPSKPNKSYYYGGGTDLYDVFMLSHMFDVGELKPVKEKYNKNILLAVLILSGEIGHDNMIRAEREIYDKTGASSKLSQMGAQAKQETAKLKHVFIRDVAIYYFVMDDTNFPKTHNGFISWADSLNNESDTVLDPICDCCGTSKTYLKNLLKKPGGGKYSKGRISQIIRGITKEAKRKQSI